MWLTTEIYLNSLGIDDLADYSEFLLERQAFQRHSSEEDKWQKLPCLKGVCTTCGQVLCPKPLFVFQDEAYIQRDRVEHLS
ncbi:hypothetical protein [Hyella patelloides]|uniref:hypothetical protein n=1 Tax=Hyella patelloides TaxID=1982969 RepID=UPI001643EB44|nr:hypothetical protein [Hyella patelloides]